ncbi:MAG: hypothetical protein H6861_07355 [Rhodospirillales bacterium]|nr:hypothetical protein [Rhodospirillales bacterium]
MAEDKDLQEVPLVNKYRERVAGDNTVWADTITPPTAEQTAKLAGFANEGMKSDLLHGHTADLGSDATFWDKIGTKDGFHIAPVDEKTGQFRFENLTQTTLPTLGGTIGAVIAPLEKEWLVGLDFDVNVKGTIRVQMAKPGEDLGPAGYKLSHNIKTDLKFYNEKVEDPLKVSGEALWIEKSKEIPSFAFNHKEETNLESAMADLGNAPTDLAFAPSDTANKSDTPGIAPDTSPLPAPIEKNVDLFAQFNPEDAHKGYKGPAPSLIDAKVTFSGEYRLNAEINVETEHTLTVPRQDYERIKAELDGQTVYSASVAGSVTVWNPGADSEGNASELFVHVGLDKFQTKSGINETLTMAKLLQDEKDGAGQQYIAELNGKTPPPVNPYLQKAPAETMIAKAKPEPEFIGTKDDIKLAQASCNLMIDGLELSVDGIAGEKTDRCVGAVLGDTFDPNNYQKNAENLQELITLTPPAREKAEFYAAQVLKNPQNHSIPAYSFQAYEKAMQGEHFKFDGLPGKGTLLAAKNPSSILENQPGIEAIAEAPKPGGETPSLRCEFGKVCGPETAANDPSFDNPALPVVANTTTQAISPMTPG